MQNTFHMRDLDSITVGTPLLILGQQYRFVPILGHPDRVYAEIGRQARIYRLQIDGGQHQAALKVFHSAEKAQQLLQESPSLSERVATHFRRDDDLHHIGLSAARRLVLRPDLFRAIVERFPSLTNAVFMDWIQGESWANVIEDRQTFTASSSAWLAHRLSGILVGLESRRLAHCDLSGTNLLFSKQRDKVELIDLESLYWPGRSVPLPVPAGTDGYVPTWVQQQGLWGERADRLSGAILLCEILAWRFKGIRDIRAGAAYFQSAEFGHRTPRYDAMVAHLAHIHPLLQILFNRLWFCHDLNLPSLREWRASVEASSG